MRVRRLCRSDRPRLVQVIRGTTEFNASEAACAIELIDIALSATDQRDYEFLVAVDENDVAVGYVCYGSSPMTDATWDLYWIAVAKSARGTGVGFSLLAALEEELKRSGARQVLIETGSNPVYTKSRAFYERCGYGLVAQVPDYYKVGDDLVIYRKVISTDENSRHL